MTVERHLRVFLLHAHSDKAAVNALYTRLTRDGIDTWLDKEKLLPGANWELEIRKAVLESDVVIVCVSRQFNQAGFRQKEVRIALENALERPEGEIFIIPARLEESEMIESLRKWHWVDLFEESGYQALLRALQVRANKIGATVRIKENKSSHSKDVIISPTDSWNPVVTNIQKANNLKQISMISEKVGEISFLDSDPELRRFWIAISDISQYVTAALNSGTVYNRKEQLLSALKTTRQIVATIASYPTYHATRQVEASLHSWESLIERELQFANQKDQIPNVYIAGTPLSEKSKVFKGRKDLFRLLERELATEAEQRPALLLFGARRTGKTSVLRQLSTMLGPNVIPVTVDLQGVALANDATSVFSSMITEIRRSAFATRHLDLPDADRASLQSDPYMACSEWLRKVDNSLQKHWMLLCFDEYEYLEKMLNEKRVDIRVFQLLRNFIQNYRHITILFSGSHTFDELAGLWSNYLINVRTLTIGALEESEARELILHPINPYPLKYTDNAVERIISSTACQPFLLQATCRDLVNILNDEGRLYADEKDVIRALKIVLTSGSSYFHDLWQGETNDKQRKMMTFIAKRKGKPVKEAELRKYGDSSDITKLENHDVIVKTKDGYCFKIELVRQWIENKY